MLVLCNGTVTGLDVGGVAYDGTYVPNATGMVDIRVVLNVPAGVHLVQGISRQVPWTLPIEASVPADLGLSHPVQIPTPVGPVHVIFKKLRDM